jgi:hypothetical protein
MDTELTTDTLRCVHESQAKREERKEREVEVAESSSLWRP